MQDFAQFHYELNKKNAIKGNIETKLESILTLFTKTKLQSLATMHKIAGRSKMSKEQLVEALVPALKDASTLLETLLVMSEPEWRLFEEVLESNKPLAYDDAPKAYYSYLLDKGIIQLFLFEERIYLVIADELKETWEGLNKQEVRKEKRQYQLIYQYIAALTNLYGAFKPEQLVALYNKQQNTSLTEEELMRYVHRFLEKGQLFFWQAPYIVSSYFEEADAESGMQLADLLRKRSGKPFYEPDARELLKYADPSYYEITSELQTLYDYVGSYLCEDKDVLESLMDNIQLSCSMEASMSEIMEEFVRNDIVFDSTEQMHLVSSIINEVYNNTRLWSNAGFTPYEVNGKLEGSSNIGGNKEVKAKKVGRNDPCTCGSGKKYKKCCGA